MGEQEKTIKYRFLVAIPHKARSMASRVYRGEDRRLCDWGGPFKSHPRNQNEKQVKRLAFFVLVGGVKSVYARPPGYETDERSSMG